MKKPRSSEVNGRPALVKQLCEVLKGFWQEEPDKEKTKLKVKSLEVALVSLPPD